MGGPVAPGRNPTRSFLTATSLIYAIGAGRGRGFDPGLALQPIPVKRFNFYGVVSSDKRLRTLENFGVSVFQAAKKACDHVFLVYRVDFE